MVCYGPSKGCQRCRQRKIRCDERKPFCGNCEKSKRPCTGYDRAKGLLVSQEAGIVAGPRTTIAPGSRRSSSQSSTPFASPRASPSPSVTSPCGLTKSKPRRRRCVSADTTPRIVDAVTCDTGLTHGINIALERRQTALRECFVESHVLDRVGSTVHENQTHHSLNIHQLLHHCSDLPSTMHAILTLILLDDFSTPHTAVVTAANMIAYSKMARTGSPRLATGTEYNTQRSLSEYTKCLRHVHESLTDPAQAESDDLLLAVLMLAFYERSEKPALSTHLCSFRSDMISSPTASNAVSTSSTITSGGEAAHIAGALALIKSRPRDSFYPSPRSTQLLQATRVQLTKYCTRTNDYRFLKEFDDALGPLTTGPAAASAPGDNTLPFEALGLVTPF